MYVCINTLGGWKWFYSSEPEVGGNAVELISCTVCVKMADAPASKTDEID